MVKLLSLLALSTIIPIFSSALRELETRDVSDPDLFGRELDEAEAAVYAREIQGLFARQHDSERVHIARRSPTKASNRRFVNFMKHLLPRGPYEGADGQENPTPVAHRKKHKVHPRKHQHHHKQPQLSRRELDVISSPSLLPRGPDEEATAQENPAPVSQGNKVHSRHHQHQHHHHNNNKKRGLHSPHSLKSRSKTTHPIDHSSSLSSSTKNKPTPHAQASGRTARSTKEELAQIHNVRRDFIELVNRDLGNDELLERDLDYELSVRDLAEEELFRRFYDDLD